MCLFYKNKSLKLVKNDFEKNAAREVEARSH